MWRERFGGGGVGVEVSAGFGAVFRGATGRSTTSGTVELACGRFSGKPPELATAAAAGAGTVVMTVRSGGARCGLSSAVTSFASDLERWKKRGRTSLRFSAVSTF